MFHATAWFFHHHVVASTQQGAADNVQRLGGTHGGDDLLGRGLHGYACQLGGQGTPQAYVALGFAVL
jgi:hypothetical protein